MADRSSALFILGSTIVGAAVGLPLGGLLGALSGGLTGVCVSMCADAVVKARRSGRLQDAPAVAIDGLNQQQKFAVLGQGIGGGSIDFRPKALLAAQRAEEMAEEDLEGALREASALENLHPHSPAVSMVHARIALKAGQRQRSVQAANRALERATRGGMNAIAVDSLLELESAMRDELALSTHAWTQLARALRAAGHQDEATWAASRAESVDPELDAQLRRAALEAAGSALRRMSENEVDE